MEKKQENQIAMFCHLSALFGFIIPMGSILGPLVVWLVKRGDSEVIDDQGKEALNFQITVFLALLLSIPLWFVCIGVIVTPLIAIADVVFVALAAMAANSGEDYSYPYTIRFIK